MRIFGPSNFNSSALQSGEGFASLFGKLARFGSKIAHKVVPAATKGLAKLGKSKLAREIGENLMKSGVNAATDIASNLIEGKGDALEIAKERLRSTIKELADILRKRNPYNNESESISDEESIIPLKKKKTVKARKKKVSSKKRKKFSLFKELEKNV